MEEERPRVSGDIPSYKDLVQRSYKRVPRMVMPKGVRVRMGVGVRKVFLVLGILLALASMFCSLLEEATSIELPVNVEVGPQQYYMAHVQNQHVGNVIKINVTISGGNNDIHYYWIEPSGKKHDIGIKRNRIYDVIKTDQKGMYQFYFANDMSLVTPKHISGKVIVNNPDMEFLFGMLSAVFLILSVVLILASIYKKVIIRVDGDEIEAHIKPGLMGHYVELKVNGFKLDEKIGKEGIAFKVGENESRTFEVYGEGFIIERWYFLVDGQVVKTTIEIF